MRFTQHWRLTAALLLTTITVHPLCAQITPSAQMPSVQPPVESSIPSPVASSSHRDQGHSHPPVTPAEHVIVPASQTNESTVAPAQTPDVADDPPTESPRVPLETGTPLSNLVPPGLISVGHGGFYREGELGHHEPAHGASVSSGGKHWYEKINFRGYSQVRYGRTLASDPNGVEPQLLGDRGIGDVEGFSLRRARLVFFGDITDHLYVYLQPDFVATPSDTSGNTFFGQARDWYGDIHVDTNKVHRFRVGQSKIPYGYVNMQSSQNRIPLDRDDALNSAVTRNERDLGVFYYWTPVEKQKLFKRLVDDNLKGSGNYGVFAFGAYNGQGGSTLDENKQLYLVTRLTNPFELDNGQIVELSVQCFTGNYVVSTSEIRILGQGDPVAPKAASKGTIDQRIAWTAVLYPQPFGLTCEWNIGRGPGLNDAQTEVIDRPINGGYALATYKYESSRCGVFFPYTRYSYFMGGYRSAKNAPYGTTVAWDLGLEWQVRKELEFVLEYSFVDRVNTTAINRDGALSYQNFQGQLLRLQCQFNY